MRILLVTITSILVSLCGDVNEITQLKQQQYSQPHQTITQHLKQANPRLQHTTARQFTKAIIKAGEQFNVDPLLIVGVVVTESTVNPHAKNYNNTCIGSMQVYKFIWNKTLVKEGIIECGEDYYDIEKGIMAGTYILSHYISKTRTLEEALKKYSGGAKNYHTKATRYL